MTPHTQAAFVTSFVDREGRQPTPQEVWDAAIRSYRDLAQPASVPAGRSQLTAVDAAKLSGLMHDAAIRYSDGYTVDFDAEASEFLVGAAPQPAQAVPMKGTLKLNDPSVQRRLAAQWGYVQAPAPAPVPAENLPTKEHIRELAQEAMDQVMEQAQVFASAWSLVGGKFDFGNAMSDAEEAKDELRTMVRSLADLAAETVRPAPCAAVAPLTDEQFEAAMQRDVPGWRPDADLAVFAHVVRHVVERAHGIAPSSGSNATAPVVQAGHTATELARFLAWREPKASRRPRLWDEVEATGIPDSLRGRFVAGDEQARWEAWQARSDSDHTTRLLATLELLVSYTEACEALLNSTPAGQVDFAKRMIAKMGGRAFSQAGERQADFAHLSAWADSGTEDHDAWQCDRCDGEGWHWVEREGVEWRDKVSTKEHCEQCDGLGWLGPDAAKAAAAKKVQPPVQNKEQS